jgi:hypothetical protein
MDRFFVPLALVDLTALALLRRLNWKILIAYLVIDGLIATKSTLPMTMICD